MKLIKFGTEVEGYDPDNMLRSPDINFRKHWERGKTVTSYLGAFTFGALSWGLISGYFHRKNQTQRDKQIRRIMS